MLKKIIKWGAFSIFLLLSIIFFIPIFGGIMMKEYILSIVSAILFALFSFISFKIYKIKTLSNEQGKKIEDNINVQTKFTCPSKENEKYSVLSDIKDNKKISNRDLHFFLHNQVHRQGIQILESLEIISETKNIDTLSGRIDFINSMYSNFIEVKSAPQYQRYVQKAIDEYKTMYYDKILKDFQISLLLYPDLIHLEKFYGNSIYQSFKRFAENQQKEIDKLKMEAAKNKRRENIIKIGYNAKYLFKTFDIPDYENNLEKIEEIRKKYYNYQ